MRATLARLITAATLALSVSGCATAPEPDPTPTVPPVSQEPTPAPSEAPTQVAPEPSSIAWLDTDLTDAATGRRFRLSDYKGKPVLLHAFAVW